MIYQLTQDYAALEKRVELLEIGMDLSILQSQYDALGARLTALEQSTLPRRALLQPSDVSYVRSYVDNIDPYGNGMTLWYVGGELRVLTTWYTGVTGVPSAQKLLRELRFPISGNSMQVSRYLGSQSLGGDWNRISLNWDEQDGRLWVGSHTDYYAINSTSSFFSFALDKTTGGMSGFKGRWGFQNIRGEFGKGINLRVPAWFQSQYSLPARCTIGGGYGSLMSQGLHVSLGPLFLLHNDFNTYAGMGYDNTSQYNIPSTEYKIAADCRSGSRPTDWYSSCPSNTRYAYADRPFDRGVRLTASKNYFDGATNQCKNDIRGENPQAPPTVDPIPTGHWLHDNVAAIDPDGWGRWNWDEYTDCAFWLDNDNGTALKHGIGIVGRFGTGKVYYMSSAGHQDGGAVELHWYDPATLAAVASGSLAAYKCRPAWILDLSPYLDAWRKTGQQRGAWKVSGAYDPVQSKMFIMLHNSQFSGSNRPSIHEFNIAI